MFYDDWEFEGHLGVHVFWTHNPIKKLPSGHQHFYEWNLKKCQSQGYIIEFLNLHIIPKTLYKDIMPYFDKFMDDYMVEI